MSAVAAHAMRRENPSLPLLDFKTKALCAIPFFGMIADMKAHESLKNQAELIVKKLSADTAEPINHNATHAENLAKANKKLDQQKQAQVEVARVMKTLDTYRGVGKVRNFLTVALLITVLFTGVITPLSALGIVGVGFGSLHSFTGDLVFLARKGVHGQFELLVKQSLLTQELIASISKRPY